MPYYLNEVPSGLTKTVLPIMVATQVFIIRWLAALRLVEVVPLLLPNLLRPGAEPPTFLFSAPLGVAQFWLAKLVVERRVIFSIYAVATIGLLIVQSFLPHSGFLILGFVISFVAMRDWLPKNKSDVPPELTLAPPASPKVWLVSALFVAAAMLFVISAYPLAFR